MKPGSSQDGGPSFGGNLRPLAVGIAVALVWGGLLWVVLGHPGRSYLSENLIFQRPNVSHGASVSPSLDVGPDGRRVWSLPLEAKPGLQWAGIRGLGFAMDVSAGKPRHLGVRYRSFGTVTAELRGADGRVWFSTPGEVPLRDEMLLELLAAQPATDASSAASPAAAPTRLELRLSTAAPENISFWAHAVPKGWVGGASFPMGWLRVAESGPSSPDGEERYLTGHLTRDSQGAVLRRIDLLRFLWGEGSTAPDPVWGLVVSTILLGSAGALIAALRRADERPWRHALAAALAIGGFGTTQAMLHAPFSPPDEPDHVLSYAGHFRDDRLPPALLQLAQRDHSERVRARVYEHFSAADMGQSSTALWSEHVNTTPLRMSDRSAATCRFWDLTRFLLRDASAGGVILRLRLLAVLTVSLAGGAAAYWLTTGTRTGPSLAWWPILLAPALTMFGMQVSNYFLLIGAQLAFAALVAHPWGEGLRDRWRGLALGAVAGVCFVTSRAAIPLVAAVVVMLSARVLLPCGTATGAERARRAAWFWLLLGAGVMVPSALSLQDYDEAARQTWESVVTLSAPAWVRRMPFPAGVLVAVVVGAVAETIGGLSLAKTGQDRSRSGMRCGPLFRGLAIAGPVALMAMPLLGWLPDFQELSGQPDARTFVSSVLGSMLTSFGLWHRDYLLSDTFWRAYGYNEAVGPRFLVSVVCLLLVAGWSLRLWSAAGRPRAAVHALFMLSACGVYLTALAFGGWQSQHGLRARYLAGFYIFLLVGAGLGWAALADALPERWGRKLRLLWLLPLLAHGSSLWAVAERQF